MEQAHPTIIQVGGRFINLNSLSWEETGNPNAIDLVFIGGNQSIRLQQQEAQQMINYLKSHSTNLE